MLHARKQMLVQGELGPDCRVDEGDPNRSSESSAHRRGVVWGLALSCCKTYVCRTVHDDDSGTSEVAMGNSGVLPL
jgi:hypothetical protein